MYDPDAYEEHAEEIMNVKGGFGQAILAGAVVAVVTVAVNRILPDHATDDRSTVASIATLTAEVGDLTKKVDKLSEQPYASRADLATVENRVSGLEQRVTDDERSQQPGFRRQADRQ